MKILKVISLCLLSFGLFVATSAIAAISFQLKILIAGLIYFIIVWTVIRNYKSINSILISSIFLLPLIIFILPIHIKEFEKSLLVLPSTILIALGCITAYLANRANKKLFKYGMAGALVILSIISYTIVYDRLYNKVSFGVFSNQTFESLPDFHVVNSLRSEVSIEEIQKGKILIFDFWNSKCLPCFQLFPSIDSINKIKPSNIDIYTINIPLYKETPDSTIGIIEKKNYSFGKLYAKNDRLAEEFRILAYPTTLVVKENKILFRGDFIEAYEFAQSLNN